MDSFKATPQDIYEVLEQQKKLQEMRSMIAGVLEKVNQTINAITVCCLQLLRFDFHEWIRLNEIITLFV